MQCIFIVCYKCISLEKFLEFTFFFFFLEVHFYLLESLEMEAFPLKYPMILILILYVGSWQFSIYNFILIGHTQPTYKKFYMTSSHTVLENTFSERSGHSIQSLTIYFTIVEEYLFFTLRFPQVDCRFLFEVDKHVAIYPQTL